LWKETHLNENLWNNTTLSLTRNCLICWQIKIQTTMKSTMRHCWQVNSKHKFVKIDEMLNLFLYFGFWVEKLWLYCVCLMNCVNWNIWFFDWRSVDCWRNHFVDCVDFEKETKEWEEEQ
jgi:hypothetical protein